VNSYGLAVGALLAMGACGALSAVSAAAIQVVSGRRVGMGTVLGLGSASNGAGIVIGSVIGGVLVDRFDISAAFAFSGVMMAAGAFVFLALTRGLPTREPVDFALLVNDGGPESQPAG